MQEICDYPNQLNVLFLTEVNARDIIMIVFIKKCLMPSQYMYC